jgi:hypothetical protein
VSRVGAAVAGTLIWNSADGLHLDVRGLECPRPLLEVLRTIDGGEVTALIVHLDQEPLLLYAELDGRGWSHEMLPADADGVQLRLTCLQP